MDAGIVAMILVVVFLALALVALCYSKREQLYAVMRPIASVPEDKPEISSGPAEDSLLGLMTSLNDNQKAQLKKVLSLQQQQCALQQLQLLQIDPKDKADPSTKDISPPKPSTFTVQRPPPPKAQASTPAHFVSSMQSSHFQSSSSHPAPAETPPQNNDLCLSNPFTDRMQRDPGRAPAPSARAADLPVAV